MWQEVNLLQILLAFQARGGDCWNEWCQNGQQNQNRGTGKRNLALQPPIEHSLTNTIQRWLFVLWVWLRAPRRCPCFYPLSGLQRWALIDAQPTSCSSPTSHLSCPCTNPLCLCRPWSQSPGWSRCKSPLYFIPCHKMTVLLLARIPRWVPHAPGLRTSSSRRSKAPVLKV